MREIRTAGFAWGVGYKGISPRPGSTNHNISHDLLMKAVRKHTQNPWILLYIERWLKAPISNEGELTYRDKGTPQGGVISPLLSNLFLHYVFDVWLTRRHPNIPWSRYADDGVLHCRTNKQAQYMMNQLKQRLAACGLEMNSSKSSIVCCANTAQSWDGDNRSFDYLGYTFRVRRSMNSKTGKVSGNFLPGVSRDSLNAMRKRIRKLKIHRWTNCSIEEIAMKINPMINTAIGHKLDPYQYLVALFQQVPYCQTEQDYRALLPDQIIITQ